MNIAQKAEKLHSLYVEHGAKKTLGLVKDKLHLKAREFETDAIPAEITIEIMDTCNLKCEHCFLQFWDKPDKGFMEFPTFKRIIGSISPLLEGGSLVNFASTECLFHKNFFDMMDLVLKHNPKNNDIKINTNGMLLTEKRIEKLIEREIFKICVSLDGCQKETVESFKTGVKFDNIIRNIKKLKERGGDQVKLYTIFVAHRGNIAELMDYVDFCNELGVAHIKISGLLSYGVSMVNDCLYSRDGMKDIDKLYHDAQVKAEGLGMTLTHESTKVKAVGCGLSRTMYISKEGNISPCNILSRKTPLAFFDKKGTSKKIIWGNVFEEDPYEIWTKQVSWEFRRLLHNRKLPAACNLCVYGHNVIC